MDEDNLTLSKEQLENLADLMSQEISNFEEDVVSRYKFIFYDLTQFIYRRKIKNQNISSCFNKEMMDSRNYSNVNNYFLLDEIKDVACSRDLYKQKFNFMRKGIPLPTTSEIFMEDVPSNFDLYDDELKEFAEYHRHARISRTFSIEQSIIVNSKGGIAIQSIPFFEISYYEGYEPLPISRSIKAVCSTDEDIKRFPSLIKFIADPTPEKKIKNSKSFSEAFYELYKISALRYENFKEAGIPQKRLYDVVMLTGVPVHEIFGHHFEEPIQLLNSNEINTFSYGDEIGNKELILSDDPHQTIEGFRVLGFTNFDAYGRKRDKRVHIKDDKVVGFLGSEYVDLENLEGFINLKDSPFVGNASQHIDGSVPQSRMSCTCLDGKIDNFDIEGKILVIAHEGETFKTTKSYSVRSKESYIVQDGIPKRILPLNISGGINQALTNLLLIDDESYQIGVCTKSNSDVPVSQFTKSQVWQGQQVYPSPLPKELIQTLKNKDV